MEVHHFQIARKHMIKRMTLHYKEHSAKSPKQMLLQRTVNTLRLHAHGCEDISSGKTLPHFHFIFYTKTFVGAETCFRKTLAKTLGKKNVPKDCNVKLSSVTYLELCLKMEITISSSALPMYGDKLSMISTSQVTFEMIFQYKSISEFQRESYPQLTGMDDKERVAQSCYKLLQLQESDAVFKDSVVDYMENIMRRFGTIEASHQSNTMKVESIEAQKTKI